MSDQIVHAVNAGGKGYAFPYDDVEGAGGDQSGYVNDGSPQLLTVTVGGLQELGHTVPFPSCLVSGAVGVAGEFCICSRGIPLGTVF